VGGAVEHNFLIFMSLSNADYALSTPDPMMKIADIASGAGSFEIAVGRPLEWDQIVPYFGRREIVKGGVYSFYAFTAAQPLDDASWRGEVDREARPGWIQPYVTKSKLDCPPHEP
jgi:hypothetical protein